MDKFYTSLCEGHARLTAKMSPDSRPSDTPAQNQTLQTKQTTEPYPRCQGAGPTAAREALFSNSHQCHNKAVAQGEHMTDLLLPSPVGAPATGQAWSSPSPRFKPDLPKQKTKTSPGVLEMHSPGAAALSSLTVEQINFIKRLVLRSTPPSPWKNSASLGPSDGSQAAQGGAARPPEWVHTAQDAARTRRGYASLVNAPRRPDQARP
jgi:hypothetical protein